MLKEKIENIKALITKKTEGDNKKNIENLVVFLVLVIITVISINIIWKDDDNDTKGDMYKQLSKLSNEVEDGNITVESEYNLKENLEKILSKISGVGEVSVLITYNETSQVVAMYNETYKESITEESDTNGGTRTIQETDNTKDIIYKEENGEKIPITQKVIMPQIEGALIIAEGANQANVKANIIQAVEALTGLPTHKVQVFEMKQSQ